MKTNIDVGFVLFPALTAVRSFDPHDPSQSRDCNSSCEIERLDLLKFVALVKAEAEASSEGTLRTCTQSSTFPRGAPLWEHCEYIALV